MIKTCIVASHITNTVRLLYFQAMLRSWSAQSVKCDLLVVLSAASESLLEKAKKILDGYQGIHVILYKGSQFQKIAYAAIKCDLNLQPDDWVIFADDDDLWHPDRVRVFNNCVEQVNPVVDQIRIPVAAEIRMDYVFGDELSKAERVLLPSVVSSELFHRLDFVHRNMWTIAVKYKHLSRFCNLAHVNLLQHKYCDYAFTTYLMTSPHFTRVFQVFPCYYELFGLEPTNWMYFFRLNRDCTQVCLQPSSSMVYDGSRVLFQSMLKKIRLELMEDCTDFTKFTYVNECLEEVLKMIPFIFEKLELQYMQNITCKVDFDMFMQMYFKQSPTITDGKISVIKYIMRKLGNQVEATFLASFAYLTTLQPPRHEPVNLLEVIQCKNGVSMTIEELYKVANIVVVNKT